MSSGVAKRDCIQRPADFSSRLTIKELPKAKLRWGYRTISFNSSRAERNFELGPKLDWANSFCIMILKSGENMPKPVMINFEEVEQNPDRVEVKWGSKEVISRIFSVNPSTVTRWIKEMRDNPNFKQYVINPTHKIVLIHLDGFEEYARWLQDNRYKR